MNHADRQRLSELLAVLGDEIGPTEGARASIALAEARAIVDKPAPTTPPGFSKGGIDPTTERITLTFTGQSIPQSEIKAAVLAAFADQAPSPKLDAFLTEPIHEYLPREPRGIHRAPGRLKAVIGLTLATIALIALTATGSATPSPSHQPAPTKPGEPASWTSQTGFHQGDAPWTTQHRPGTPGNGLGVNTP